MQPKQKTNISELFCTAKSNSTFLKICAPMVRYSKLEFRTLVKRYGVDLCYTPMIMADSFCRSNKARLNEFTTAVDDTPLIAQFAANTVLDFVSGAEMISPYVDGVDLNCGCPQRWAMADGYGSALLSRPDLIKDMVLGVRRNLPTTFSVSVKIRLLQKSIEATVELCRQLEKCGVDFLTVHGRTKNQKTSEPVDKVAIGEIRKSVQIPLVANGDVMSLEDAQAMFESTGCAGTMAARGMLANPAMYAGFAETPRSCVEDWVDLGYRAGDNIIFQCFHHHLTFMLERFMNKSDRIVFNNFTKKSQVFEFMEARHNIVPRVDAAWKHLICEYEDKKYRRDLLVERNGGDYDPTSTNGQYFNEMTNLLDVDGEDSGNFMNNLFDE